MQRRLDTPGRGRRRYRIPLTPLADTMFNLLIFFMLASNITPYSILGLSSGSIDADTGEGEVAGAGETPMAEAAVWTVGRDEVVASGQRFALTRLPDLAAALNLAGTTDILLVTDRRARVQDLAMVLETLARSGIVNVQVAASGGGE